MKTTIVACLFFAVSFCNAQTYLFSCKSFNDKLYIGMDNLFNLVSKDYKNKNLKLEIDNDTIKKYDDDQVIIYPKNKGVANVKIFAKLKNIWKEFASYRLIVEDFPKPEFNICYYKNGDTITLSKIDSTIKFNIGYYDRIMCDVKFQLHSLLAIVIGNDSVVLNKKIEAINFKNEMLELKSMLKENDRLTFSKIKSTTLAKLNDELEDVYYYIK